MIDLWWPLKYAIQQLNSLAMGTRYGVLFVATLSLWWFMVHAGGMRQLLRLIRRTVAVSSQLLMTHVVDLVLDVWPSQLARSRGQAPPSFAFAVGGMTERVTVRRGERKEANDGRTFGYRKGFPWKRSIALFALPVICWSALSDSAQKGDPDAITVVTSWQNAWNKMDAWSQQ